MSARAGTDGSDMQIAVQDALSCFIASPQNYAAGIINLFF